MFLLLFFFFEILSSSILYAKSEKLDPRLSVILAHPERLSTLAESGQVLRKEAEGYFVETIVTFNGDPAELKKVGAVLRCVWRDLAVVRIPIEQLPQLADLDNVTYVEANRTTRLNLDDSVPAIGALKVRDQFGLTGKGVIIGIIDSGIDWQHQDFITPDGKTRIKCLLDLSESGNVYGGRVYTEDDINAALFGLGVVRQRDFVGHGTHVAGIAAGDGGEGNGFGTYAGVAPEADLVIVKATRTTDGQDFTTSDQLIAMKFIDSVATALAEPFVINLSLGGHDGAHDGTSASERAIDQLVGTGKPGKAVVTVAGNEGEDNIHASGTFSSSIRSITVDLDIAPYVSTPQVGDDRAQIVAWYSGDAFTSITLKSPSGQSYGPVSPGTVIDQSGSEGTIYVWNGFYEKDNGYVSGANPFNGDKEVYIQIGEKANTPPATGTWKIIFQSIRGRFDTWIGYASMQAQFSSQVDDAVKVSVPGTSKNVITVGAFISKRVWRDIDGNRLTFDSQGNFDIGQLAGFSNPGPPRDAVTKNSGRIKPDIAAPGQMIGATFSRDAQPYVSGSIFHSDNSDFPNALILGDGKHAVHQGTSMAAPHVAGVIALLFQKHPDLTAMQIQNILHQSAAKDNDTGDVPNNYWGFGKIDAFAALQINPSQEPPSDFRLLQGYPNPFAATTTLRYDLPITNSGTHTSIRIYNSIGQLVRDLVDEEQWSGQHVTFWDGTNDRGYPLANGVYIVRFEAGSHKQTFKLVLLRSGK